MTKDWNARISEEVLLATAIETRDLGFLKNEGITSEYFLRYQDLAERVFKDSDKLGQVPPKKILERVEVSLKDYSPTSDLEEIRYHISILKVGGR